MSTNLRPTKRRRTTLSLLKLPDEVLAQIICILPPKAAFLLSLTNKRLRQLYTVSASTIDATTPFRTQSLYTPAHLTSLLRHTRNLKTLNLCAPLPDIVHGLPLRSLRFFDTLARTHKHFVIADIPSLRELHIHSPIPCSRTALCSFIPRLTKLTLTSIRFDAHEFLRSVSDSVNRSNLQHLTLSFSLMTADGIETLVSAVRTLKHHPSLLTLACGFVTPENVARSFVQASQHKFFTRISWLRQLFRERQPRRDTTLRKLHIFSPVFDHALFRGLVPIAMGADITCSFEANSLQLPLAGGCVVTELASMPTMRYLSEMNGVRTKLHTFNFVLRELATTCVDDYVRGFAGLITEQLHTFRVQIPLRSTTNLDPIATTLFAIMNISSRVKHLHISREVVHFAGEGLMPSFMQAWASLEALYLTAPEEFPQDPYPERVSRKYSAWRFVVSLPSFLEILPRVSPNLKTLMLEEIGFMSTVENPTAMTMLIEAALKAVRKFEHELPAVDAGTVRAQLLVWRSRSLREVRA